MRAALPELDALLAGARLASLSGDGDTARPIHFPACDLGAVTGGFDRAELCGLLAHGCLDRRDLRIVREGASDPERMVFDAQGIASLPAAMGAYADGFTLVLNNLQRRSRGVSFLVRAMELGLRQPVGANAYLTPASARGLAPHFDDHDVFVLQIDGEKTWHVHPALRELPLRGEHVEVDPQRIGPEVATFRLRPGELLYLPRGWIHHARTDARSSLHLTLGVSAYRQSDLLARIAGLKARATRGLRESLSLRGRAASAAALGIDDGDVRRFGDAALRAIEIDFIATLAPLVDGGIGMLDALDQIGLETRVRHRVGSLACLEEGDDDVRLHFPGNVVVCPSTARAALAFIAERGAFMPLELPAPLADASRLALVRKLVAAGLLVPDDDA
jgi:hypothetical protein